MPIRAQAVGARRVPLMGSGRPRERNGAGVVSLLRREPREVYRVYDEDEFLAGEGGEGADHEETPPALRGELPRERISTAVASSGRATVVRRFAGPAMLVGAVAAVAGLVVSSNLPSRRAMGRRLDAGRGAAPAAVRPARSSRAQMRAAQISAARPPWSGEHVDRREPSATRASARRRATPPRRASHAVLPRDEVTLYDVALQTSSSRGEEPQAVLGEFGFEH